MKTKYLVNKQNNKVKDGILAAAIKLIAMKSYSIVTIQDIAKESGCGSSLLYFHFKQGKMEILLSIVISYWQKLVRDVIEEVALSFDPIRSIGIITDKLFSSLTANRMLRLQAVVLSETLPDRVAEPNKIIDEITCQIYYFNKIFSLKIMNAQDQGMISNSLNADAIRDILIGSARGLASELGLQECGFKKAEYTVQSAREAYSKLLQSFIDKK